MIERICDTNIFYGLAFNHITESNLRLPQARLLISPVSIIEITSNVTENNFEQRRDVAKAVLEYADEFLIDPESYLANIWAVQSNQPQIDWSHALRALANAASLQELDQGVADWQSRIIRKVNIPLIHNWRTYHYNNFVAQMYTAIESLRPGYTTDRLAGQIGISDPEKTRLINEIQNPAVLLATIEATRQRAYLTVNETPPPPMENVDIDHIIKHLLPYAIVYQKYLEKVSTIYAPQPNDWGDLECFIYLKENRQVATSENRWIEIANEVGLGEMVFDPS